MFKVLDGGQNGMPDVSDLPSRAMIYKLFIEIKIWDIKKLRP